MENYNIRQYCFCIMVNIQRTKMKYKYKLTRKEIEELKELLCSWEDDNISDYEYCIETGKILGLGNWTWKGVKK